MKAAEVIPALDAVCWRRPLCRWRRKLAHEQATWLLARDSLTRRLRLLERALEVTVLAQRLVRQQRVLLRCVSLGSREQPWVFGFTEMPRTVLTGRNARLAHLGTRALGDYLFRCAHIYRGAIELSQIMPSHRLFALIAPDVEPRPAEIWLRRSRFHLGIGKQIKVTEVFLPALWERLGGHNSDSGMSSPFFSAFKPIIR